MIYKIGRDFRAFTKYIGVAATITITRLEEIAGELERLTILEADA